MRQHQQNRNITLDITYTQISSKKTSQSEILHTKYLCTIINLISVYLHLGSIFVLERSAYDVKCRGLSNTIPISADEGAGLVVVLLQVPGERGVWSAALEEAKLPKRDDEEH